MSNYNFPLHKISFNKNGKLASSTIEKETSFRDDEKLETDMGLVWVLGAVHDATLCTEAA